MLHPFFTAPRSGVVMVKRRARKRMTLVLDNSKKPDVTVKPGQRLDVVAVNVVSTARPRRPIGGRLCGGAAPPLALLRIPEREHPTAGRGPGPPPYNLHLAR